VRHGSNDFGPVWYGARALLAGQNPYDVVGPGGAYEWAWPLAYPFPALLAAVPVAALAEQLAAAVFTACSAGVFAYVLTRPRQGEARWGPLAGLLSASMWGAVQLAQWSPILSAAAIVPGLGWLLAAKPTIGAALFLAYPRRSTVVGGLLVLAVSLLVLPGWPIDWLQNTSTLTHLVAPVTILPFGPLLLLALLKWRRPEARLLAALACVPTTGTVNDTLPLFLIPATAGEAVALALASHVAQAWIGSDTEYPSFTIWAATSAARLVPLVYLPALVLVLRRPNEGSSAELGWPRRAGHDAAS